MVCAFGPIGFEVEEPQVVVHEGHPPERVGDLADSDLWAGKDPAEVDFAPTAAETTAAGGHDDGAIVERVFEPRQALIGA